MFLDSRLKASKINLLLRVSELNFRDQMRSSDIWTVFPFDWRSQLRWFVLPSQNQSLFLLAKYAAYKEWVLVFASINVTQNNIE